MRNVQSLLQYDGVELTVEDGPQALLTTHQRYVGVIQQSAGMQLQQQMWGFHFQQKVLLLFFPTLQEDENFLPILSLFLNYMSFQGVPLYKKKCNYHDFKYLCNFILFFSFHFNFMQCLKVKLVLSASSFLSQTCSVQCFAIVSCLVTQKEYFVKQNGNDKRR